MATWLMLAGFSVTEGLLVYLIFTFLGGLTRQQRKRLSKKLAGLGEPTVAELEAEKESAE